MEFDFLPKLPKSNLDDRTFQDLVDECILRIPRYCPEWTNHNPSDPGITLVELFAWLTDQMLVRFNQVPRQNYITFLELLGIRLQPPAPAKVDLTFYLTASLPEAYTIPKGTEVATVRTETEAAIVFSTDRPLTITTPAIQHFLTSETTEDIPRALRDRFTNAWTLRDGEWSGREQSLFNDQPRPGNCFYLVLDGTQDVAGNVVALTVKGEAATPTGINPDQPPRRWEAWNGETWEPVLLQEADDETSGFSFSEMARQGLSPLQGADVILHLPQMFPVAHFIAYQGYWLRCVCLPPAPGQPAYTHTPRIVGLGVRAIGGSINASQSSRVEEETLGISDGTPGQTFQLQFTPVLERQEGEQIMVLPPGGLPQTWQEVKDFADSNPNDLHYTVDSITGLVQFGPLIREPVQLKEQTRLRAGASNQETDIRPEGSVTALLPTADVVRELGHQYGAVPPRGAIIRMSTYRTGGGQQGNVQTGTLRVMKSSVPYVARVINHNPAVNGADAESLDHAVIRAPRMLRTRDRAVTVEDFEALALAGGGGAIARALCLPATTGKEAGKVRLLLVPQADTRSIERGEGIHPDRLNLTAQLRQQVMTYLDDRRLLGVQVQLSQPEYVGVSVQTEVALEPAYNNPQAQQEILAALRVALYRFLNPLTGGADGNGWQFGRPVYPSDIVTLFQRTPGVRYLGVVQLFELRKQGDIWIRSLPSDPVINPGSLGLVCSWLDNRLRSGHVINFIE